MKERLNDDDLRDVWTSTTGENPPFHQLSAMFKLLQCNHAFLSISSQCIRLQKYKIGVVRKSGMQVIVSVVVPLLKQFYHNNGIMINSDYKSGF